jgi:phosphoribosylanthranilate isomerase
MFRIKVCGITSIDDALSAADAGVDAIGLNFCPQSPRYLSRDAAHRIVEALGRRAATVGVFVNERPASVLATATSLTLDYIQLHGDEPPEFLATLAPRSIVRAFRVGSSYEAALDYLQRCRAHGHLPAAVLVDSFESGKFGGTGKTANLESLMNLPREIDPLPLVLAGGLNPENVAAAIRQVRPAAVDVASGVETAPGQKDAARMARFVAAARHAWADLGRR